jgi:hypothetical protein
LYCLVNWVIYKKIRDLKYLTYFVKDVEFLINLLWCDVHR